MNLGAVSVHLSCGEYIALHFSELHMLLPVGVAILVAAAVWVLFRLSSAWLKYRGQRVIQCPENRRPAGVVVDASHAAFTALGKGPDLRLSQCSRWPERAGCGQECLSQIQAAPEDCLVRSIIAKWYRGKACSACGQDIGAIDWGCAPCLLLKSGISVEWTQVPADKVDETLASAKAICFPCHTARTLVREHPELATDRHRAV
jgi:hypothetical protein